jgi:hypothetical protein
VILGSGLETGGTTMAKKITRKGVPPPPKCKAILLCERAIIEAGTGRVHLVGLLEKFILPQLPGQVPPFTAYLQLTDGIVQHEYEISVELHDLSNGTVLATEGPRVKWKDRLTRLNLIMPVKALRVSHAGAYDFVVFADDQEIDRQKFRVDVLPDQTDSKDQENG